MANSINEYDRVEVCDDATRDEKLKRAVFLSHGLCNNNRAREIASLANSTPEDIVRLCSGDRILRDMWRRPVKGATRILRKSWATRVNEGRKVRFVDTIYGRVFNNAGWGEFAKDHFGSLTADEFKEGYMPCDFVRVFAFARVGLPKEFLDGHPRIDQMFKNVSLDFRAEKNAGSRKIEYVKYRKEFFDSEVKWINQMPDDLATELENDEKYQYLVSLTQSVWNCGGYISDTESWEKAEHLKRGDTLRFYAMAIPEYLEYMGIGVIGRRQKKWMSGATSRKGLTALPKVVVSVQNKFISMVSKGFDPAIVREDCISMLNAWSEQKTEIQWKFYARKDAKTEYPDIEVKKKRSSSNGGGSSKKEIVKLSDEEAPKFTTADGRTLVFNVTEK